MDTAWPDQLVELRSYRLVAGSRDAFVDHFEARFLASQEGLGMDIVGLFRPLDDADRFVWVRRFLDPPARGAALAAFYSGPVWREHGPRANELMVDHTDVHLVAPDPSMPAFAADHVPHARRAGTAPVAGAPSTVVAAIYDIDGGGGLDPRVSGAMAAACGERPGVAELSRLVTARVPNEFPRLPVHDTPVAVWLLSDRDQGRGALAAAGAVADTCGLVWRATRLAPTARSTLR